MFLHVPFLTRSSVTDTEEENQFFKQQQSLYNVLLILLLSCFQQVSWISCVNTLRLLLIIQVR